MRGPVLILDRFNARAMLKPKALVEVLAQVTNGGVQSTV